MRLRRFSERRLFLRLACLSGLCILLLIALGVSYVKMDYKAVCLVDAEPSNVNWFREFPAIAPEYARIASDARLARNIARHSKAEAVGDLPLAVAEALERHEHRQEGKGTGTETEEYFIADAFPHEMAHQVRSGSGAIFRIEESPLLKPIRALLDLEETRITIYAPNGLAAPGMSLSFPQDATLIFTRASRPRSPAYAAGAAVSGSMAFESAKRDVVRVRLRAHIPTYYSLNGARGFDGVVEIKRTYTFIIQSQPMRTMSD